MKTHNSTRVAQATYFTGDTSSSVEEVAYSARHEVISQVINGDRKKPNPLHFTGKKIFNGPAHNLSTRVLTNGKQVTTGYLGSAAFFPDNDSGPTTVLGSDLSPGSHFPELSDNAIGSVYSQLRSDANLSVDWAERHETLKMLRNLTNVRKNIISLFDESARLARGKRTKRGRPSRYGKTRGQTILDIATEKWLGVRYGIMPLIHSTYDLLDAIAKQSIPKPLINSFRGRSAKVTTSSKSFPPGSFGKPGVCTTIGALSESVQYIAAFTRSDTFDIVADFTSLNPLGIAWEVVPLSFVADWFVNVGEQLSLWENYFLYTGRLNGAIIKTRRWKLEQTHSYLYYRIAPPRVDIDGLYYDEIIEENVSYNTHSRHYSFERTLDYDLPVPQGFRLRVRTNAKRHLDAAALLHQLIAKRSR